MTTTSHWSGPGAWKAALDDDRLRVGLRDGKTFIGGNKAGDVFWSEAVTHEVGNIRGKDSRALPVEPKSAPNSKSWWKQSAR